jgi:hypothetical protein
MRKLVIAIILAVSSAGVLAHEHKVLGTVTMAGADHVMMTMTDGKAVTVTVTADTKVTKGKAPVKIAALKPGTRIVVTTESDEAPYTAKLIQVGAAPPAAKKK